MLLLLAIAAVLDPWFKMKYIEFVCSKVKGRTGTHKLQLFWVPSANILMNMWFVFLKKKTSWVIHLLPIQIQKDTLLVQHMWIIFLVCWKTTTSSSNRVISLQKNQTWIAIWRNLSYLGARILVHWLGGELQALSILPFQRWHMIFCLFQFLLQLHMRHHSIPNQGQLTNI